MAHMNEAVGRRCRIRHMVNLSKCIHLQLNKATKEAGGWQEKVSCFSYFVNQILGKVIQQIESTENFEVLKREMRSYLSNIKGTINNSTKVQIQLPDSAQKKVELVNKSCPDNQNMLTAENNATAQCAEESVIAKVCTLASIDTAAINEPVCADQEMMAEHQNTEELVAVQPPQFGDIMATETLTDTRGNIDPIVQINNAETPDPPIGDMLSCGGQENASENHLHNEPEETNASQNNLQTDGSNM